MDVAVDHEGRAKRRIRIPQFVIAGVRHGSPPEVVGTGMNQCQAGLGVQRRKSFQPSQAFFADTRERRGNQFLDYGKKRPELLLSGGKFCQTFRGPKHLIGVSADPGPAEPADLIDDVRRVSSTVSQIAALENNVRCNLPQVGENGLEGAPVAVNIRYDRDSHSVRRAPLNIAPRLRCHPERSEGSAVSLCPCSAAPPRFVLLWSSSLSCLP